MEPSMDDRVITLHLTPKQRELIRRETGYRPWVLRFRLGELQKRIAIQEGDIEESEQTELDDLLAHARS